MTWVRLLLGCVAMLAVLAGPAIVEAGLYCSKETVADLPCRWRGLLNDLRMLRSTAVRPANGVPLSPLRDLYETEAARLRELRKAGKLSADEYADLGAYLIRLGEIEPALEVLREGHRRHSDHFAIAANLGTAWQVYGDLNQAAEALRLAVESAPEALRPVEELHLRLVESRRREPPGVQRPDDLFGIDLLHGNFQPGVVDEPRLARLPKEAVAHVQRLALALPNDPRLLWLIGELAHASGDVQIASEVFDLCVSQYGLNDPVLRTRRLAARSAAEKWRAEGGGSRAEHEKHQARFQPKSRRALLVRTFDPSSLPPVDPQGVNPLPWGLLGETDVSRRFPPGFPPRLKELNDLQVSLHGFMQPLTEDTELTALLLVEYPTGCWYCEMPEITGIVLVELKEGSSVAYTRNQVRVTGRLVLNAADPEGFLYTIRDARVVEAD
ncbi:MAG: DUF3299 domain-containing protein [Gemmatales bacterium]|nr:DUF3299 domain-containing protein [Gemmatales bacterium]MDW8386512.1 DUF3299 domain-containing protein [Gemmatales bacterium]